MSACFEDIRETDKICIDVRMRIGELIAHASLRGLMPDNVAELMAQPDIDGALVGGASLEPDSFSQLVLRGGGNG